MASYLNNCSDGGALVATLGYKGKDKWIPDTDCYFHIMQYQEELSNYEREIALSGCFKYFGLYILEYWEH